MKRTLYFIRHAQSHPSRLLPDAQWPLSQKGMVQATRLATLLIALGIDQVFSSPYLRCMQTIEPFAEAASMKIEQRQGLHERKISKTLIENFHAVWRQSWEDFDFALPGCESNRQAQSRFIETVRAVVRESPSQTIGICTHGAVIGLLLHTIEEDAGREQAEALTNPDVLRIAIDDEHWNWDREFQLPGLLALTSHPDETPIDLA